MDSPQSLQGAPDAFESRSSLLGSESCLVLAVAAASCAPSSFKEQSMEISAPHAQQVYGMSREQVKNMFLWTQL